MASRVRDEAGDSPLNPVICPIPVEDWPDIDLQVLWSFVLRSMVDSRHGGCLVVVPEATAPTLTEGYALRAIPLGDQLVETWLSVSRALKSVDGNTDDLLLVEAARRSAAHLQLAAQTVGRLTATDGCVVCDRNLVVHGFGRVIRSQAATPVRCFRVDGNESVGCDETDLFKPFGTRHRSAFQLCKSTPASLTFVVSQDGDLRVFARDSDGVHFYDDLRP